MAAPTFTEIERKYDAADDLPLPDLVGLPGVSATAEPVAQRLVAVYHDTADLALARASITLRRRTGGDDAGWHLKLPVSGDRREEVRLPLTDESEEVPAALLERVLVHVRDRPVVAVVRLENERLVHRLLDAAGAVVAEVCDDHVVASRLLEDGTPQSWREWEVELVGGSGDLLEETGQRLLDAGAVPAAGPSKLARALGLQAPGRPADDDEGPPSPEGPASRLLLAYLGQQAHQLVRMDPLVRVDAPDAVHKMRVAARRARSALATYEPLLAEGAGAWLRGELRWLGSELGAARDTEVIRGRIERLLEEQPDDAVRAAAAAQVETTMDARHELAAITARAELSGPRYFRLLDALEEFLAAPPLTDRGERRARDEAVRLLRRDWKRLRRRTKVAAGSGRQERAAALHDVRKAAKRLRYAAESAVPVLGGPAEELVRACTELQDLLGEHQDAIVTADTLQDLRRAALRGTGTRGLFKRLRRQEHQYAEELAPGYQDVLDALPAGHRGRWLRGGKD